MKIQRQAAKEVKIITTLPQSAPLIDRMVDVIEHNLEAHSQTYWAARVVLNGDAPEDDIAIDRFPCGTTACAAGWTVLLSGYTIAFDEGSALSTETGSGRSIDHFAQELLGLDDDQASRLFYHTGNLIEIREAVSEIKTDWDAVIAAERAAAEEDSE